MASGLSEAGRAIVLQRVLGRMVVSDVPLAEAIEALRAQLSAAITAGADSELRFEVSELTLDLEVAMTTAGQGRAGIRFWLVDFGAKAEHTNAATHRVTLKLRPVDAVGRAIKLSDAGRAKPA